MLPKLFKHIHKITSTYLYLISHIMSLQQYVLPHNYGILLGSIIIQILEC